MKPIYTFPIYYKTSAHHVKVVSDKLGIWVTNKTHIEVLSSPFYYINNDSEQLPMYKYSTESEFNAAFDAAIENITKIKSK